MYIYMYIYWNIFVYIYVCTNFFVYVYGVRVCVCEYIYVHTIHCICRQKIHSQVSKKRRAVHLQALPLPAKTIIRSSSVPTHTHKHCSTTMCVHIYAHALTHMHIYVRHIRMHVWTYREYESRLKHISTPSHTHTHTHTHAYTHINTSSTTQIRISAVKHRGGEGVVQ